MLHLSPRLAALVAATAVAVPAALAVPGSAKAPVAGVRVSECSTGPEANDRFVEFRGAMQQTAGSETMWMRFGLQERLGDRAFARTRVPGLGMWRKSRPGVLRFVHRQQVLALAEGSEYRARVHFRWYDADGELVKETVRRSPSCRQQGNLPNLVVNQIRANPAAGPPGVDRYEVRVVNRGRAAVDGAELALAVDAAALDTVAVGALEPGEGRQVSVNGPACKKWARAEADPADTVGESSESDNVLRSPCPLPR